MMRFSSQNLPSGIGDRSEEHTSELQSLTNLVCRLLLEKKKKEVDTANNSQHGQSAGMEAGERVSRHPLLQAPTAGRKKTKRQLHRSSHWQSRMLFEESD